MRTLLTGVPGRVGSRLAPRLAARTPLRVLVRDPDRVAPYWDQGHDVVIGDLRDPDAVKRAVHGVDAVVHLAAAFRGVDEAETVAVNRDAAAQLGRAALEAGGSRVVFASTRPGYRPRPGGAAHPGDQARPGGPPDPPSQTAGPAGPP